jgi:uncharacterized protein
LGNRRTESARGLKDRQRSFDVTTEQVTGAFAGSLDLDQGALLGQVAHLDRSWLEVSITDPAILDRVTVTDLVSFDTDADFLIGVVDSVINAGGGLESFAQRVGSDSRTEYVEGGINRDQGASGDGAGVQAIARVTPIGAFRPDEGAGGYFTRGASVYPHVGGDCHLLDGDLLERFMSILAEGVPEDERLILGRYVGGRKALAVADGNRLFQRHVALLGSTGSGKSWAVALMLERAARLQHANLIVFDLHGEYGPLTRPAGGRPPIARGLRVAGPSDIGRVDENLLHLPYWLLRRDELMTMLTNINDPNAPDQILRLTEHLQTLKQISLVEAGRDDATATFTVDSPIPYRLDHLVSMLTQDNLERIPQHPSNRLEPGPYFGRLTGIINRLESRVSDPRFSFIFNPPEHTLSYQWLMDKAAVLLQAGPGDTGIKVIDLSEVPSSVLPIVVGVLARFVYDVQFWIDPSKRVPLCMVCDEAHLYLPAREGSAPVHSASLAAFEAIAKEGRKYGVALLVVSQRPADVSRTILSQCNNFIVMRIANDHDQSMIERLIPETVGGVKGTLPVLDIGEAVVIGDALLLSNRLKFDPPEVQPSSTTQPYWSMWTEQASSRDAIDAGVEALRNQSRDQAGAAGSSPAAFGA